MILIMIFFKKKINSFFESYYNLKKSQVLMEYWSNTTNNIDAVKLSKR